MGELVSFEEYKDRLDRLDDDKARLNKVIYDILDGSECKYPIFYGKAESRTNSSTGKNYILMTNIRCLSGEPLYYPYIFERIKGKTSLTAYYGKGCNEGEDYFFSLQLGPLIKEHELVSVCTGSIVPVKESDIDVMRTRFCEVEKIWKSIDEHTIQNKQLQAENIKLNEERKQLQVGYDSLKLARDELENVVNELADKNEELDNLQQKCNELANPLDELKRLQSMGLFQSTDTNEYSHDITAKHESTDNEDLCAYIKARLPYEYEKAKVERFLTALYTTQIIVLCGKPGTGKTTFAASMAKALGAEFTPVQVQSNWSETSDIMGFFNPIDKSFHSTPFVDALINAKNDYDRNGENARLHIICLDEMNLAKVEYYFATFLSLLQLEGEEREILLLPSSMCNIANAVINKVKDNTDYIPTEEEKRLTSTLNDYASFKLPPNVRFVGTLNMDETTQTLSPKVVDRSFFIEFMNDDGDGYNDKYTKATEYVAYTSFTQSEEKKTLADEIKNTFAAENKRFTNYLEQMYDGYLCLMQNEITINDFCDMIACSKLLPTVTSNEKFAKFDKNYDNFENNWTLTAERMNKIKSAEDDDGKTYWEQIC